MIEKIVAENTEPKNMAMVGIMGIGETSAGGGVLIIIIYMKMQKNGVAIRPVAIKILIKEIRELEIPLKPKTPATAITEGITNPPSPKYQ